MMRLHPTLAALLVLPALLFLAALVLGLILVIEPEDPAVSSQDTMGLLILLLALVAAAGGLTLWLAWLAVLRPLRRIARQAAEGALDPAAWPAPRFEIRELDSLLGNLRQAMALNRGRERELKAILDNASDGIVATDMSGRIVRANAAMAEMFQYPVAELIGSNVMSLMEDYDAEQNSRFLETYLETGEAPQFARGREIVGRRRDGSSFLVLLTVSAVRTPAGRILVGNMRDVTRERTSEFYLYGLSNRDADSGLFNATAWRTEISGLYEGGDRSLRFWVLLVTIRNLDEMIITFGVGAEPQIFSSVLALLRQRLTQAEVVARLSRSRLAFVIPDAAGRPDPDLAGNLIAAFKAGVTFESYSAYPDLELVVVPDAQRFKDAREALAAFEAALSWSAQTADERVSHVMQFDERAVATLRERTEIATRLADAMAKDQIFPVYQPQLDLRTGRVRGVETLMRWRSADGTMVSPGLFIPVAERVGLIADLDTAVAQRALTDLRTGALGIPEEALLSLNTSPKELGLPGWVEQMAELVAAAGIAPGRIEIEITETALVEDLSQTAALVHRLRGLGFCVAIDDFGSGYASMTYLRDLPADLLKIDQTFVQDLVSSARVRVMVGAVIRMAHDLGMRVIAEGVEDAETQRILQEQDCDLIQGWHFARPMPAPELAVFCQRVAARRVAAEHG